MCFQSVNEILQNKNYISEMLSFQVKRKLFKME